ncbi:chromosome partitioning protein [Wohlfahrtiimonas chitiniclastica]|uniref:ParA family protein n=1 Tax=Wohlfahrtiimonas chitiniclastica TaxID=400946 RepID=UPI000B98AC86|nr:AAA family ATPase [Wohlfahrtiimonas chitiniclastica]MBS7814806.1 ParA family protein [Wohlfahrtiimonas chitiniclastica]MBS7836730.1 ParA family protein [Wohlfahrtiimonas chitiniclastica]OYQ70377.1 chromosome partitioning protein [Wohlfahrtiimonas chitiniclastica]OYQ82319.1 chromosome partitioning protein [Wohlfahrtiimonas chitiniclastica]OYQ83604.1 chromosome partitioning protein [Wohlfahrtiimonas chitiniclastica]
MAIIAVTNQKGGVGKTTTAVNLAASLASMKARPNVLLLDLDPQGNATTGMGVDKHSLELGVVDLLLDDVPINEAIIELDENAIRLIGANGDLTGAEVLLTQREQGAFVLKEALASIQSNFNYIIIDCPPSLNMLTLNALTAANYAVVPVQCEYYALEGLSALMGTVEEVKSTTNPNLSILGILRTMYDGRNALSLQVSENLQAHFGDQLLETIIPRNVRLAEAPGFGESIVKYDAASKGAVAYAELAKEISRRSKRR